MKENPTLRKHTNASYIFGLAEYQSHRNKVKTILKILNKHNLTYLEWVTLHFANKNMTYKEMCELLGVQKNTLSNYVKKLEKKGFILIDMIYEDGYGKTFSLTRFGEITFKEIEKEIFKIMNYFIKRGSFYGFKEYKTFQDNFLLNK